MSAGSDREQIARQVVRNTFGGPIERQPAAVVNRLLGLSVSLALLATDEQERRQRRGALRLVAADGQLTLAGRRHVRARRAARTRAARRSVS